MTILYILPLATVAYFNLDTFLRIDVKHRQYYITFVVNIIMCLLSILVIIIREIEFSIFPPLILMMLMGITIWQRNSMITDLKQGKYQKQNTKRKR